MGLLVKLSNLNGIIVFIQNMGIIRNEEQLRTVGQTTVDTEHERLNANGLEGLQGTIQYDESTT